jgi:hypothetical protein
MRVISALMTAIPAAALAKAPLELETITDEKYTEQVVSMADLSDGTFVKVHFGVSNVGPGDGKGACQFQVIDGSGQTIADEVIVEREEWSYAEQKLQIGPCVATQDGKLVMRAPLAKGSVELSLEAQPIREEAHAAKVGGEFYHLDTIVKWAKADATFDVDGKKRTVSGFGYADHNRSNILPGTLAKRWLRFRSLSERDPRLVLVRFPASGDPIGWHDSRAKGRTVLDRVMLAPDGKAWRARFKGTGGEWRVTTTKLLQRIAPVEQQGAVLGSVIGAVIGNPVTYLYRGVLEERGTGAEIPGIVEVAIIDE